MFQAKSIWNLHNLITPVKEFVMKWLVEDENAWNPRWNLCTAFNNVYLYKLKRCGCLWLVYSTLWDLQYKNTTEIGENTLPLLSKIYIFLCVHRMCDVYVKMCHMFVRHLHAQNSVQRIKHTRPTNSAQYTCLFAYVYWNNRDYCFTFTFRNPF
jgi:hypothetical protein